MDTYKLWISFYTIVRKDVVRMFRIWSQTFLPSVVTSVLYFLIFGSVLGSTIGAIDGYDYIAFVVPGLIMLAVVTNSYSNTATTFFTSKFFMRNIDEVLVSPTPPWLLVLGLVMGGVFRGVVIGLLVLLVSFFFVVPTIASFWTLLLFLVLSSLVFSLAGLVNGIYAKNFDSITIVPTFVLTPLVYLGGVFYSISMLPLWWQSATYANPIFYIINGFRYGFLGTADVALWISVLVLILMIAILGALNWYLIKTGLGLKQ